MEQEQAKARIAELESEVARLNTVVNQLLAVKSVGAKYSNITRARMQKEAIKTAYESGMSRVGIMETFKINPRAMYTVLEELGLYTKPGGKGRPRKDK